MVAITPIAMRALDAIRRAGVASVEKVFGLSGLQIALRVKAIVKAAGLSDWEIFSVHSDRAGMASRLPRRGGSPRCFQKRRVVVSPRRRPAPSRRCNPPALSSVTVKGSVCYTSSRFRKATEIAALL